MNAPWKAGAISGREPFAAYLCDDDTLATVRPVIEDMGWSTDKCHKGGLRNAVQSLSVTASPNILLVDLSESGDPLSDINALAEVCEPGTVVVAMGQINDVRLFRDLIVSGIQDYLLKPFSADQLREVLAQAQTVLTAPKTEEAKGTRAHVSAALIGTRGGVGTSLLATSLAWMLSKDRERLTALLDLDVHFGTGALSLDLEPGRGLTDAIDNPSRIDGLFIERAMIKANDKLSILSSEAPINQPLMTDGAAFYQLQEEFRTSFEHTVIDLPRDMLISYPHLMADVNVVVLVAELTLASARDTIRLLAWLKAQAAHARVLVVANRAQTGSLEISKQDFENSIERKIDIMVPLDAKGAAQAAKLGKPYAEVNRASKTTQQIGEIADALCGATEGSEEADAGGGKSGSLLSKLSGFKFRGKDQPKAPAAPPAAEEKAAA